MDLDNASEPHLLSSSPPQPQPQPQPQSKSQSQPYPQPQVQSQSQSQSQPSPSSSQYSETTRLNAESIYVISQSLPNLPPLTDAAVAELAPDAEYRLREIVQDSIKFMKHSKRSRLLPSDVSAALRLRNVEPIFGFSNHNRYKSPSSLPPLTDPAATVGAPKLATSPAAAVPPPAQAPVPRFTLVEGTSDLFFQEDNELSIKSLLQAQMPALPLEVTVNAHWLAVEGNQPAISQNPMKKAQSLSEKEEHITANTVANETPSVEVRPPLKHALSRELQMYFEQVTGAIFQDDHSHLEACLESVAQEPGIAQSLPYFTVFISNTVRQYGRDLPVLFALMRLVSALLDNEALVMERYMHQLLGPVLTCIVGKRLCANPRENHWALRDFTADLIRRICSKFSRHYPDVQSRVTKTFLQALGDPQKPLTTHYGAMVGLGCLGQHVVDSFLKRRLKDYTIRITALLNEPRLKAARRFEAAKVYGAILWAVSVPKVMPSSLYPPSEEPVANGAEGVRVKISSQRVAELLPSTDTLHSRTKEELGVDFYPYGRQTTVTKVAHSLQG